MTSVVGFTCKSCSNCYIRSSKSLSRHLKEHRKMESKKITCPFCSTAINLEKNTSSFYRHLERKDGRIRSVWGFFPRSTGESARGMSNNGRSSLSSQSCFPEFQATPEAAALASPAWGMYENFAAQFTKRKEDHRIANVAGNNIAMDILDFLMNLPPDNDIREVVEELRALVGNQKKIIRILRRSNKYVDPVEVPLSKDGLSGKYDSYCRVPMEDTLKALLDEAAMDHIVEDMKTSQMASEEVALFQSYKDGEFYRNSPEKEGLRLQLYVDDFTIHNPLRNSNRKKTKSLFVAYFALENFPYITQCKLRHLHLLLICKRSTIEDFSMEIVFQEVVEDINELASRGLEIWHRNERIILPVKLASIVGDNLAKHEIAGISKTFGLGYNCLYCEASYSDIQHIEKVSDCRMRGTEKEYAVFEETSPLSTMYNFSYTQIFAPDIMHDVCEGVVPRFLGAIAKQLLCSKDYEYINSQVKKLPFRGRIPDFSNGWKYRGTATENLELFKNFPLLIPIEKTRTELMKLYYTYREMVEILFSPIVSEGKRQKLSLLTELFLTSYKNQEIGVSVYPKLHLHLHYPLQIRQFGPLLHYSSFRYERKHQQLKNVAESSRNMKNICLTTSTRAQNYSAVQLIVGDQLNSEDIKKLRNIRKNAANEITRNYRLDTKGFEARSNTIFHGAHMTVREFYTLKKVRKYRSSLALIQHILVNKGVTMVLAELLRVKRFCKWQWIYEVEPAPRRHRYSQIDLNDLAETRPLPLFKLDNQQFVRREFEINFEESEEQRILH